MSLPRDYDAWVMADPHDGPDPVMEDCPACDGDGDFERENTVVKCGRCNGTGEVEAEAEEPDDDYEYERRRDAGWEVQP